MYFIEKTLNPGHIRHEGLDSGGESIADDPPKFDLERITEV